MATYHVSGGGDALNNFLANTVSQPSSLVIVEPGIYNSLTSVRRNYISCVALDREKHYHTRK